MKIGTLKVVANGFKLGERFIKIIFDNAIRFDVDQIYVTAFDKGENHLRLIQMLIDWGFVPHGTNTGSGGEELVLCRPCNAEYARAANSPRLRYPYAHGAARKWIVPIYPEYHTELFPDSVLRTESPMDFVENAPNRNAISKVYISRSFRRDLGPGDIIVFYRTASGGAAWYTSVATTIGVVENVVTNILTIEDFIGYCRKRSVFSDSQLAKYWNYRPNSRPFVVNLLYLYSLPRRMNRKELIESGVIGHDPPRGFEPLSDKQFNALLGGSNVDCRIVID